MLVHTDAFEEGARAQSEMLGQASIRRSEVPHPIQDKTPGEIRALATSSLEAVLCGLTQGGDAA
jgi:hypothetical protein